MRNILIVLTTLFATFNVLAQNKTEVLLTLRNGNVISGTTKMDKLTFYTDYGKLDIPIKNISSIKIGIVEETSQKENVINLLKQLNNTSEAIRKNAYESLLKLNVGVIPIIEKAIYNDPSISAATFSDYTAEALLSELKIIHGIDESTTTQDILTIDGEFTMGGRYEFSKIDLNTDYGSLSIHRDKIHSIDILFYDDDNNNEKVFKLLGSKHISSNKNGGWLKTGIMVKKGQHISISANGQVTFASLSGSTYKPDGKVVGTSGMDDYGDNYDGGAYDGGTNPMYGNVVFKIGENGKLQKAGSKYSGYAKQTGMLYISIYETIYNSSNTGSYNVKVSVK